MPVFLAIIAAILAFAWWKGRLNFAQIPPAILMAAGAIFAARGMLLYGVGGIILGAILFVLRGKMAQQKPIGPAKNLQRDIAEARRLLGVSAHDDADRIRARHRSLMARNHPDMGGSEEYAQQLNAARDLLLNELNRTDKN